MFARQKIPKRTPPIVPNATVYPLGWMDDSHYNRAIVNAPCWTFGEPLDVGKLSKAFETLLTSSEEWQRLTGRLRLNEYGKLELHVPAEYSVDMPIATITSATRTDSLSEHPAATTVKSESGLQEGVGVYFRGEAYRELFQGRERGPILDDWLYTNAPAFSLHITVFRDATTVRLSMPHTIMDGSSMGLLVHAWEDVLHGRPAPPLLPLADNPQNTFGTGGRGRQAIMYNYLCAGLSFKITNLWLRWDAYMHPEEEGRSVRLSKERVKQIHDEAMVGLADGEWVSPWDAVTAWWIKIAFAESRTNLSFNGALDCRKRHSLFPDNYLGNGAMQYVTEITPAQLRDPSHASIAISLRRALNQQSTSDEVDKQGDLQREVVTATNGHIPLFMKRGTQFGLLTNWAKAKMLQLDFGPARPDPPASSDEKEARSGPSYPHGLSLIPSGISFRDSGVALGVDMLGGYWIVPVMRKSDWPRIMERMRAQGVEAEKTVGQH